MKRLSRIDDYDSFILAATHAVLDRIVSGSRRLVGLLCGVPPEKVTLRHTEAFLVTTTVLLILLIATAERWSGRAWVGWGVIVLGNLRILQIVGLNLSTLIFDVSLVGDATEWIKRARWHFVAIGFSFFDSVLVFGFMYQFFDSRFRILNQHFSSFWDYLYYAVMTITTIGYGDIYPVHWFGRLLVIYEAVLALLFLVLFVSGAVARLHRH